jgi:hypothetical protein
VYAGDESQHDVISAVKDANDNVTIVFNNIQVIGGNTYYGAISVTSINSTVSITPFDPVSPSTQTLTFVADYDYTPIEFEVIVTSATDPDFIHKTDFTYYVNVP